MKGFPSLLIFNMSIITGLPDFGEEFAYSIRKISTEEAKGYVRNCLNLGQEIVSAIGHEAVAQILSEILETSIPVNRIPAVQKVHQDALVFKVRGRIPEGTIMNVEQVEAMGYDLFCLTRLPKTPGEAVSAIVEQYRWMFDLAQVLLNLDRCEHGRHAGECYPPCPGSNGWANPYLTPGKQIGTSGRGLPIILPNRNVLSDVRNERNLVPFHDAKCWVDFR